MKITFSRLAHVCVCLFCLSMLSDVSAQPALDAPARPSGAVVRPNAQARSFTAGVRNLYNIPFLREKLGGVTDEQVGKLNTLLDGVDKDIADFRTKNAGVSMRTPEGQAQLQKDMLVLREKMMTGLREILTKEQMDNLSIIQFQLLGGFDAPMMNREILNVLGVSEEEAKKIVGLSEARQKALTDEARMMRESPPQGMSQQEATAAFRQRILALTREYGAKIRETLTEEQRKTVEKWEKDGTELREALKKMSAPTATQP